MILAKIGIRIPNFAPIKPEVVEISRIQNAFAKILSVQKLDSQYLCNPWSDLLEILESEPDFCKDHA